MSASIFGLLGRPWPRNSTPWVAKSHHINSQHQHIINVGNSVWGIQILTGGIITQQNALKY
jgi:hypothetical protein